MTPSGSHPKHPERVCWGCAKLCRADDLACGNGTVRTPHPSELFGDDYDTPVDGETDVLIGDEETETARALPGAPSGRTKDE